MHVSLTKWLGYRLLLGNKRKKGSLDNGVEEIRMTGKKNGEIERRKDKQKGMGEDRDFFFGSFCFFGRQHKRPQQNWYAF